jgi:hypothetical protein
MQTDGRRVLMGLLTVFLFIPLKKSDGMAQGQLLSKINLVLGEFLFIYLFMGLEGGTGI